MVLLKTIRGYEKHGKTEKLSQTRENRETQLNIVWHLAWILEQKEEN